MGIWHYGSWVQIFVCCHWWERGVAQRYPIQGLWMPSAWKTSSVDPIGLPNPKMYCFTPTLVAQRSIANVWWWRLTMKIRVKHGMKGDEGCGELESDRQTAVNMFGGASLERVVAEKELWIELFSAHVQALLSKKLKGVHTRKLVPNKAGLNRW